MGSVAKWTLVLLTLVSSEQLKLTREANIHYNDHSMK